MAILKGTDAPDRIHATDLSNKIYGYGGWDGLFGGAGRDVIFGGDGADYLHGNDGDDKLLGESGEDEFWGGKGNDRIDGGNTGVDFDTVYYYSGGAGVAVNLATGLAIDEYGGIDTLIDIEAVYGTFHIDRLVGGNKANDDFESFRGYAGNDLINGGSGFDRADYARDYTSTNQSGEKGTNGITADLKDGTATDGWGDQDTLRNIEAIRSSVRHDALYGTGKANRFEPLSGSDYIDGRGGNDEVSYQSDHFYTDRLGGTVGIIGDLAKGEVRDTSGWYVDTLVNIENLTGSIFDDDIRGNGGNNRLRGEEGDDFLSGRKGNDMLLGEIGQDIVLGGGGTDTLNGGRGDDKLRGGRGDDTFVFEVGGDTDRVRDFGRDNDKLDVTDFNFASAANVLSLASQAGNNVRIELNDEDFIILENVQLGNLGASDFIT